MRLENDDPRDGWLVRTALALAVLVVLPKPSFGQG